MNGSNVKNITFKTSLFGGYAKSEVNVFLESFQQEVARWNKQVEDLKSENEQQSKEIENLKQANEIASGILTEKLNIIETLKEQLSEQKELEKTQEIIRQTLEEADLFAQKLIKEAEEKRDLLLKKAENELLQMYAQEVEAQAQAEKELEEQKRQLAKEEDRLKGIKDSLIDALLEFGEFQKNAVREFNDNITKLDGKPTVEKKAIIRELKRVEGKKRTIKKKA
ncbi:MULTISPECIES: DivIVA domain-containing protein [Enterococcus]|uniref:DivIVA domain-containing protein n=1 Tax=Candidatus Enterococcus mangumiae TaxID=2230878 RepID=A0ABZ2SW54_9ENTE|nr:MULTISPECIES: DivIVA domain-containing protein [unclassified Enterococcus]MBO0489696.1 DivIVA domain-containing protein [Enterococcus sp. DIV1094]MBO1299609.1 DivIVA domain-containing protein [Enterococcus sp. DIV1271a]